MDEEECVYCGMKGSERRRSLCIDVISCTERKEKYDMGRKAKKEAAPEDIYIEEREELALEFSKIALAGILSHEGSNGWPTPAKR